MLDHLSNGRAVLGLGRGLARFEYEHFGIDMNTSRDRFDEASRMIVDALDTGFIEGKGPFYPQLRTEIRNALSDAIGLGVNAPVRTLKSRLHLRSLPSWRVAITPTRVVRRHCAAA